MPDMPPVFRPTRMGSREQVDRAVDRDRGSARQRGYSSHWDAQAKHFKLTHPLCLGCEAVGKVMATTVVDHIIPHKGDQKLFWEPTNRQPCCDQHHNVVKQALERLYLEGKATPADLRLDSPLAQKFTRSLMISNQ